MVLEISATPYIFTFKMWDWGRLGLDGQPRPVHLEHGTANIQWERSTGWVREIWSIAVTPLASGEGWREERTGLHEREFIETRRHWFTDPCTTHARRSECMIEPLEARSGGGKPDQQPRSSSTMRKRSLFQLW